MKRLIIIALGATALVTASIHALYRVWFTAFAPAPAPGLASQSLVALCALLGAAIGLWYLFSALAWMVVSLRDPRGQSRFASTLSRISAPLVRTTVAASLTTGMALTPGLALATPGADAAAPAPAGPQVTTTIDTQLGALAPALDPAPAPPAVASAAPTPTTPAPPAVASAAPTPGQVTPPASGQDSRPTPAQVTPPTSDQDSRPLPAQVTVRSGQSLWSICAQLLRTNDATRLDGAWRSLYAANRDVIGDDPNLIVPQMVLRIPQELS